MSTTADVPEETPNETTPEEDYVEELDETSTGRWLVTTIQSQHIWDCDARTYQRMPGPDGKQFAHDNRVVAITRVERWPRVGATSLVWFDDLDHPHLLEQWRQCSRIQSIQRLTD